MKDDNLASKTNLKSLEVQALGMSNAALQKINEQEERIKQLEGALGNINMLRKLEG